MATFFYMKWCLLLAVCGTVLSAFYLLTSQGVDVKVREARRNPKLDALLANRKTEVSNAVQRNSAEKFVSKSVLPSFLLEKERNPSIHIFYYPWYGSPDTDGKYYHWNHKYLPHWDDSVNRRYPRGKHVPPNDIGASFFPLLGPYSSRNPAIIAQHMKWISSSGIDVVVVSWFHPSIVDDQGNSWDDVMPALLDACQKYRLKMTFHMEPYDNRDASSLRRDIEYIVKTYGFHPALYRTSIRNIKGAEVVRLPMLYFYDSYLVKSSEWLRLTSVSGDLSVRGTKDDVIFIGLLVKPEDKFALAGSGFDGMYTYFASEGFTYSSTPRNWPSLSKFCRDNRMMFIPSVGPGYDDRRVRPWNDENTKERNNGEYYRNMFEEAHRARAESVNVQSLGPDIINVQRLQPDIVSITSFNEWHEGTQIEPAVPFTDPATGFVYENYTEGPNQYLHLTLDLVKRFFTPLDEIPAQKIASVV